VASVREMIRAAQSEMRTTSPTPERANELLWHLTALIGNCNEEIREADMDYARVLLEHLEQDETANRAKIRAETTPEFLRKREARDTKELCTEIVRSLKIFLRGLQEEMRLSR